MVDRHDNWHLVDTSDAFERLAVRRNGHTDPGEALRQFYAGQSAHPLSPFYRAGHEAWLRGEPTPFLPGAPAHRLTLQPAASP